MYSCTYRISSLAYNMYTIFTFKNRPQVYLQHFLKLLCIEHVEAPLVILFLNACNLNCMMNGDEKCELSFKRIKCSILFIYHNIYLVHGRKFT